MVWAFLIAAVVVAPFAFVTVRRILRERRDAAGHATGHDEANAAADGDGAEDPASSRDARQVVAAIRAEALAHGPGEPFEVAVPADTTVGGRPADPGLVARLVADDLRRSGVEVDAADGDAVLRCRIP
jgi:hypothetical protein